MGRHQHSGKKGKASCQGEISSLDLKEARRWRDFRPRGESGWKHKETPPTNNNVVMPVFFTSYLGGKVMIG